MSVPPPDSATAAPPVQKRVLLVDNEEGMLEVCAEALERLGVAVTPELDPRRAAERLGAERFDLMMTNLQMPAVSGLDLLALARRVAPDMPVMVVTGYPMAETAQRCRDLGAREYLIKPFDPLELQRRARSLLRLGPD